MSGATHRTGVAALILCLALPTAARAQQVPPGDTPGTSTIAGKIRSSDGKPLAEGRVLAYHLSSEQLFSSEATTAGGDFVIKDLPYGYFDLAVETSDGLYVVNQVVNVPPAGKVAVVLTVATFDQLPTTSATQSRAFPGSDEEASGLAEVKEKPRGRDFWRSPKGVAILAGIGGVALLAIVSSGDDDEPAVSPF